MVPAGAVSDGVVVRVGDALVLAAGAGTDAHVDNLGCMPVADVVVTDDAPVIANGPDAVAAYDLALDEWVCLMANALVGVARRSVEIGVEYVKERRAWGVPIGSFQAVSHPLADAATAVDAAGLVARKAAWSSDAQPGRFSELAAMAFGLAQTAARDASYRSLHFHGGYGFMMEYDIQLYYRRARAWANVFGGPAVVDRRVADARYGAVGSFSG
jgi:alkylation response protein AidB-like acyl-CoA dehydrogenase